MPIYIFEHVTYEEYIKHLKGNIKQPFEYKNLELSGKARVENCIWEYLAYRWYTKPLNWIESFPEKAWVEHV